MRKVCFYIVGQPGSGKSTLLAVFLKGQYAVPVAKPFQHRVLPKLHAIELGAHRVNFSGTDSLAMNVQPLAVQWLTSSKFPYQYVFGEGDRLTNNTFFENLQNAGWEVAIVYLQTPDAIAEQRCVERGSHQNSTWVQSRRTKVQNFAARWATPQLTLDGTQPVEVLVAQLRTHPVIKDIFS